MTIEDQIAEYLEDNSVGTVSTDIFIAHQPASPTNCITIIATGGLRPPIDLDSRMPTFQILIRNENYENGYEKMIEIRNLLHNQYGQTLVSGEDYFHSINALSEGGSIGRDEGGNEEFSINFECYVR